MITFDDIITESSNAVISGQYLLALHRPIENIINDQTAQFLQPAVLHRHAADAIQKEKRQSACYHDVTTTGKTKQLITHTGLSIAETAFTLIYIPYNFSKLSLQRTGCGQGIFRKNDQQHILNHKKQKSSP